MLLVVQGRNKRDARQVAAAACMELLLGPKFNLKLGDFVPQSRPPAPTHSAKRDSFRQNVSERTFLHHYAL